jgi:hypothetical protein
MPIGARLATSATIDVGFVAVFDAVRARWFLTNAVGADATLAVAVD